MRRRLGPLGAKVVRPPLARKQGPGARLADRSALHSRQPPSSSGSTLVGLGIAVGIRAGVGVVTRVLGIIRVTGIRGATARGPSTPGRGGGSALPCPDLAPTPATTTAPLARGL